MIYSQDKHFLCSQCFKPADWQPDDIIVAPRRWASLDKCCVCGLGASYGAIVRVQIPGPCCGSHGGKSHMEIAIERESRESALIALAIEAARDEVGLNYQSNMPAFQRMIAKWDAQGLGDPDGVKL